MASRLSTRAGGFEPITALGLVTVLAAIVGLVGYTRRNVNWRCAATLTAISIASYLLISNSFLLIGVSVGERLMYWPSVPVLLLVACGAVHIYRREASPGQRLARSARVLRILGLATLLALGVRTAVRNTDWADTFTLARRDVVTHPRSAHLNRGLAFELFDVAMHMRDAKTRSIQFHQVDQLLERALKIEPAYPSALALRAQVRYLLDRQDPQAQRLAETALRIEPHNRDALRVLAQIKGGIAAVDARLGDLRRRVEGDPDDQALRLEYARALLGLGQSDDAREQFELLRQADPDDPEVLRLLGETLALVGRVDEARPMLAAALERNPEDWRAHANLSKLLADVDPATCLQHAQWAYELQPNDRQVAINLAEALVLNQQRGAALKLYAAIRRQIGLGDPYRAILDERIARIKSEME